MRWYSNIAPEDKREILRLRWMLDVDPDSGYTLDELREMEEKG